VIDDDIRNARTLPAAFYRDAAIFERLRERIFARSWQLVLEAGRAADPGSLLPFSFLAGCVDEPLLLARDEGGALRALSNVCTHRGNLLCTKAETGAQHLRCRYHGRRFALDGRFLSMPEFEGAEGFPTAKDSLPKVPFGVWKKLVFASLDPAFPLSELLAEIDARVGWMPLDQAAFDPGRSRDYLVRANWALYCDNYLEGFHIPYVHAALADALDYGAYRTETYPWANVQIGVASGGEDVFDLPLSSPDYGQKIAGYFFWLFPNTMLNFYPWGLSVNIARPLAPDRTKVSFLTYVWDPARLDHGAGSGLDRVEREDEAVVESVQRGVRSRLYHRGRYSPKREPCVHHFHRLLERFLQG
jgi:choline monooxygenase